MMDEQVRRLIEIWSDPRSDQSSKAQAFQSLNEFRSNLSAPQICLSLFVKSQSQDEFVRLTSLELLLGSMTVLQLDASSLLYIKDSLLEYARENYGSSADSDAAGKRDSATIQNKLAQVLTELFTVLYREHWESFFEDFWRLASTELESGGGAVQQGAAATLLYLRILNAVHDEIADQLIMASEEKQKRNAALRDLIRVRDAERIADSWQKVLVQWKELDTASVQQCLKVVGRWVSWFSISLVVQETTIARLYEIASQKEQADQKSKVVLTRNAAIECFNDIVNKKMSSADKIELVRYLRLDSVLSDLVSAPAISTAQGTSAYDTDMAEAVARLVNSIVLDIVVALETPSLNDVSKGEADRLLVLFVPRLLRFFADEFDEVCSIVIPSLNDLLTCFRKYTQQTPTLPEQYSPLLSPILKAIVAKLRYDDTYDWSEDDEDTEDAEFQNLRRSLNNLQHIIAAIDEQLYLQVLSEIVETTFTQYKSEPARVNWRDLDVALQEMYLLGDLALRNGGLYQKKKPSTAASDRLIQMMVALVQLDISSFQHPAVQLDVMEICVRYMSFFSEHTQHIPQALQAFIRYIHSDNKKVRARSWGLCNRFVMKQTPFHVSGLAREMVQAFQDLLVIKAEVPENGDDDDVSSDQGSQKADLMFTAQLNLFETAGSLTQSIESAPSQLELVELVLGPLLAGIQQHTTPALSGDEQALYQLHHEMEAVGTYAQGYTNQSRGIKAQAEFARAADIVLASLTTVKGSLVIRAAGRFAFARLINVLPEKSLDQLSNWIDGFLPASSTKDEMTAVLRQLDQLIHRFKNAIYNIFNTILTPLLQKIFAGFQNPIRGTDDEIYLGELRREYLNFLLVILNNGLESAFVSPENQGIFDTIIGTLEHFAKDQSQPGDAKLALAVLVKMVSVWGGPSIPNPTENTQSPAPILPGFDSFALSRFSPLTWTIMTAQGFNAKEATSDKVIAEVASLQQTILQKNGQTYLTYLREQELKGLGATGAVVDEYLHALTTLDVKAFKQFLQRFLAQASS